MSKRSGDLVKYAKFLVEAGVMERPVWLAALERMPPPPLPRPGRRPATISFPEDGQVAAYYARHPEAKLEALDIASFEPPAARRVAYRALELQEGGAPKGEAYRQAEAEVAAATAEQQQGSGRAAVGVLDQIQAEEESALRRAVQLFSTRNPGALAAHQAAAAEKKKQQLQRNRQDRQRLELSKGPGQPRPPLQGPPSGSRF